MHDFEKESRLINTSDQSSLQTGACVASTPSVADLEHPWVGLESFQEETRAYFFGRDAEIDELHLRLCNLPLLVLYGRSGLGKTSILKAGLIPRLREENQLPLLLRLRYGDTASDSCNQLVSAVFSERKDGQAEAISFGQALEWVRCLGEKLKFSLPEDLYSLLWLRLHYRDELPAITHLIIDQFEEVFTLGAQYPDVENCVRDILAILLQRVIPQPISKLILEHDKFLDYFDPDSIPVRVLLALRDDYVYALNRWRRHLPALSQNNFELRALRGSAAFDAVYRPGTLRCHYQGKVSEENKIETGLSPIINEETAERIVRFIAGKSDDVPLEETEVNSPILSLLCRQLNDRRFNQSPCAEQVQFDGKEDIKAILIKFYDNCLAKYSKAKAIRAFIEEELVSRSGARLAQDEKSILTAFEQGCEIDSRRVPGLGDAASARACLDDLVNQRLLSPLADSAHSYELIHDSLVKVVEEKRTEARAKREIAKAEYQQFKNTQAEALFEIRNITTKVKRVAFFVLGIILLLWCNAEMRTGVWENKIEARKSYLKCITKTGEVDKECFKKWREEISKSSGKSIINIKDITDKKNIHVKRDDAKILFDQLGIKVEVRYPAAILSLLILGLLVFLYLARRKLLRLLTARVKATKFYGEPLETANSPYLNRIWLLAPLPNQEELEVKASELKTMLQWGDDWSRRYTILVAIASILFVFMVCRFTYLGLITEEFLTSSHDLWKSTYGFWSNAIWPAALTLSACGSIFVIYAWWYKRLIPEFDGTHFRGDLSRREFILAGAISSIIATIPIVNLRNLKNILGNPRFRQPKPIRSIREPSLSIGAIRENVKSGVFHGILPSKPAKKLAREIIPIIHCVPRKPSSLPPVENAQILSKITFDTDSEGYDKKKSRVQLSRSACAFEQAALAHIVSNDIEGACQLLLAGVRHDLFYSSRMRRRSSVHLYDLLAGLAVRQDMPQHLKSLDSLIKEQKDQMSAVHKRQKIWEDTTSNWHKRWANKSKSLKWSGVPM